MTLTWFDPFFQWLLATSLRASLLAIGVLASQTFLQRWLPARWRYALWLPMVFVLLAPVLPASPWSMENRFTQGASAIQAASRLAEESFPVGLNSVTCRLRIAISHVPEQTSVWAAWLLGTTATLAGAGAGYWRTWQRIWRGVRPVDPVVTAAVSDGAAQLGLTYLPRIIASDGVDSPAVAGFFRPTLLLPAEFPSGLTPVQMRLILLHELTHLRRFDLPLNWLLYVLQAMHWFNPLLWYAFSRIRFDREAACDAQVLSGEPLDSRADYGYALLKLASAAPQSRLDLAFGGAFERAGLRSRLLAVTRHRQAHPAWSALSFAVILLLALAGATRASFEDRSASLPLVQEEASEDGLSVARFPWDIATAPFEQSSGTVLSSWSVTALKAAVNLSQDWLSRRDHLPELRLLLLNWRATSANADLALYTEASVDPGECGSFQVQSAFRNFGRTFFSWTKGA